MASRRRSSRRSGGFPAGPKLGRSATTASLQRALAHRPHWGPTNTRSGLYAGLAGTRQGGAAALTGAGGKPRRTRIGRLQARTAPQAISRLGVGKS